MEELVKAPLGMRLAGRPSRSIHLRTRRHRKVGNDAHRYGFRRTDLTVTSFIHLAVLLDHALLQKKRGRSRLAVGRAWTGTVSPAYSITSENRANDRLTYHSGHKIISAFLEISLDARSIFQCPLKYEKARCLGGFGRSRSGQSA